ncbi:hypothetical protein GCM10009007_20830 [Formosimonas limnophila]|uniref:DUF2845 domain-containing protein n=1 Tax=Formosimonas limnophila TaxID=1384487 RepID=A0A8J3G0H8_9BURK|nr:hypothetical protein [Formosimonas limnophila]GHA79742.1 hypothetical protein GCM10009007_20830 [Formosimonas limnophila]
MKKLLLALFFVSAVSHAETTRVLDTRNYIVRIVEHCSEGEVSCQKISYTGTSKSNGKSIKLKGVSKSRMCGDGVTPCQFLGYEFKNGNVKYNVREDGTLEVIDRKGRVLVSERGEWQ